MKVHIVEAYHDNFLVIVTTTKKRIYEWMKQNHQCFDEEGNKFSTYDISEYKESKHCDPAHTIKWDIEVTK